MANKKPNAKADDRYKKEIIKKAKVDKKKEKKLQPADAPVHFFTPLFDNLQ
jgi:hypothetical protein